jgi:hypothetical protein
MKCKWENLAEKNGDRFRGHEGECITTTDILLYRIITIPEPLKTEQYIISISRL